MQPAAARWADVTDRRRATVRNALVVAQIATALVLLAGAGLLVRSLWRLQVVDTGMTTSKMIAMRLWLPQPNEPSSGPYFNHEKRVALIRGILARLHASPEIVHAGMATGLPAVQDTGTVGFSAEGWTPDRRDLATVTPISVTPGYFRAIGARLVAGRLLSDTDDERAQRAVVVNETLARAYFASEDPVGRRFHFVGRRGQVAPNAPWQTIVGVIRDVKEDGLDAAVRPQVYQSLFQLSNLNLAIVAQGRAGPPPASVLQHAVQSTDPNLPVYAVRTGEELVASQLAHRRFATRLVNAFAVMALLLAALGLHGVIAYGVRQRTHEIGVRVALGATAARVMGLVLGQAARLTALGVAIGVAAALVLLRGLRTMLFEIAPSDPWTLVSTAILLAAVVGVTTLGSARRAGRIHPAVALRE